MRVLPAMALVLLLSAPLAAQKAAQPCPPGNATSSNCDQEKHGPSAQEIKQAHRDYERAKRLERKGQLQQALSPLEAAMKLDPTNRSYASEREMVRQQLVKNHLDRGNALVNSGDSDAAAAEFRQAVELDPGNQYAVQRLQDMLPRSVSASPVSEPLSPSLSVVANSKPIVLEPAPGLHEFHFKGPLRNLLQEIASAYGLKAVVDESVQSKQVQFNLEPVDLFTALDAITRVGHVFWVPLTSKQIIFANDTPQLHRDYDEMVTRTFYLADASTPQELNDVVNLLRTIFEIRFIVAQQDDFSIVVRAPERTLDAAARVVQNFLGRKPQVDLDVQVYQISSSLTKQLGLNMPTQFQAINIPAGALAALAGTNVQNLINQLISSGGVNSLNSTALQGLLSQLQNQQQNSVLTQLLNTPFATFGGGTTLFALTVPALSGNFQFNQSDVKTLEKLTLRTSQNTAATMLIGERYPILNATFAPLYNSSAISQALASGSYIQPFPSYTYEDLGISLKATPQVLSDRSVNLKLEMSIKALTGQSFNGVPVITNREYSASMSIQDGEQAFVVGMITQSEQKSLSGIPGLSQIPGLNRLTSSTNRDLEDDELLIVVTPYVVSAPRTPADSPEVWLPAS